MQPIERYGLIALVFLVITIAAACLWDPKDSDKQDGEKSAATAAAGSPAGAPAGEPRPRDFVGARSQGHAGQSLSDRQRERLQALQQEEASATAPQGDEISAREAALARREAALAAREAGAEPASEEAPQFKSHLAERAGELFDAASGKAHEVADFVRPEPKTASVTPPATKRTYEVKKGDTLSEIASNELGTWKRWQEIIDANPGLDANNMRVGARIALPADAVASRGADKSGARAGSAENPSSVEKTGATYVVQENDSMWDIAEKALGDGDRWREIAAANPKVNPDKLLVGQRLSLPAGAAPTKASSDGQRVAQAEAPKRGKVR